MVDAARADCEAGRARQARRLDHRDLRRGPGVESRVDGAAPTRRRGSSTFERRGSGSARICARRAAATSRAPGNRLFSDLLTDEGTFRPVEEMLSIIRVERRRPGRGSSDVLPGRRCAPRSPGSCSMSWPASRTSATTQARGRNGATARTPDRSALTGSADDQVVSLIVGMPRERRRRCSGAALRYPSDRSPRRGSAGAMPAPRSGVAQW